MKKTFILTLFICWFCTEAAEDFSYKPYLVLLVHGFGNGPWAMGINTTKNENVEEFPDNHVGNVLHPYFNEGRKS